MLSIIYAIIFGITVLLFVIAMVILYQVIFKRKKYYKFLGLLATVISMLGVLLTYNPPENNTNTALTTEVSFFNRTFAIIDDHVYKTMISNEKAFGDYELMYTITNNSETSIKIDNVSLLVNSYEKADVELISPEGGGGGESSYHYYYCKLEEEQNYLTYLGTEYGQFNLEDNKKSYLKIDGHDLEAASVYFDCDNMGLYELSLRIEYSGEEKGEYISEPLKVYIVSYEMEQETAKIIPLSNESKMLDVLYKLSDKNGIISNFKYKKLQDEISR